MSEDNAQSQEKAPVGDWLLRTWIATAGKGNGGLGVTITTAAGLISGVLISEMEFLDGISEGLADGFNGQGEAFRGMFDQLRELDGKMPITHIHLKQAKLLTSNGMAEVGLKGLWRGELTAVIGHSVGQFSLA
ncbi:MULTISPECIES: hypothetical protein [Pseudomonas]|uniref:hypothetical protein n=1 Tax=Pseudomonas TaxID=286 RepID=UPI000C188EE4|nr:MULTISPECIES: hypothetical protein [Pseudomonas]PIK76368.1 hypothetical protein CQW31_22525 [Pseudomonas sp. 382]